MDREERLGAFDRLLLAIEPIRAAHLEWRAAYEAEASAVYGSLEYETQLKLVFHVFRMLATNVGSYRYLIYDKLDFGMDAYAVLFDGLDINNALVTERDRDRTIAPTDADVELAAGAFDEYRERGGEDAATWFEVQAARLDSEEAASAG